MLPDLISIARKPAAQVVLAGLAYVAIYVLWSWPLVLQADTHVAVPRSVIERADESDQRLIMNDQRLTIRATAKNASSIISARPWNLIDQGLCYPTPNAAFLGEHMIEAGMLAAIPLALTGNPLVAYNFACLAAVAIAGISMFVLIRHWTGSAGAGFVAGLLFAYHPSRTGDLVHLATVGTHWLPLAIFCFERLLYRGRPRDVAWMVLVSVLQALTGSHPLLTFALFGGAFGAVRVVQYRSLLDERRAAALGVALVLLAFVMAVLLASHLGVQETWQAVRGQTKSFITYVDLRPGGAAAVGAMVLVLAALLIVPRKAGVGGVVPGLIAGTVACLVVSTVGPLWPGGPTVPSLYGYLSSWFPPLYYLREPAALRLGAYAGIAMLGGVGLGHVVMRLKAERRAAVVALAVAVALMETLYPAGAKAIYGRSQELMFIEQVPDEEVLAAYRAFDDAGYGGAIVDLPYQADMTAILDAMPEYVLLGAYHRRPLAACYNSFTVPSFFNVARLASRLPSPRGVNELAAAGLRNLVVHHPGGTNEMAKRLGRLTGVTRVYTSTSASAFRIVRKIATESDPELLDLRAVRSLSSMRGNRATQALHAEIINDNSKTWTLSRPIRPLLAKVRLKRAGMEDVRLERTIMLPLALAPGQTDFVPVELAPAPAPGTYRVELEIPELGWAASSGSPVVIQ